MKKNLLVLLLLGVFSLQLHAQEMSPQERMKEFGLADDQVARLMKGQKLDDLSARDKTEFSLFVKNSYLAPKLVSLMNALRPKLSAESLSYLPNQSNANRVDLLNAMLRLSSLSSLQYYDPSKRKTQQLIFGATTVDSPNAVSGKPDNLLSSRPDTYTAYLRQTDDVFGAVNYQVDYYASSDEVAMVLTNVDSMKTKVIPFPFASKGDYCFIIQYIPLYPAKGSLLYTAILNKQDPMTLSRANLINMLMSYMEAYKEWFVANYPASKEK